MIFIPRTDSKNQDFIDLVKALDAELAIRDGDYHAFYDQFNNIDQIKYAIVCYENQKAIACGAIKKFDASNMEVKRMYVLPENRKKGFAQMVLAELEQWAKELGFERCVLETGKNQPEAIQLYLKSGYSITPNYGQYKHIKNSVCFEKILTKN